MLRMTERLVDSYQLDVHHLFLKTMVAFLQSSGTVTEFSDFWNIVVKQVQVLPLSFSE